MEVVSIFSAKEKKEAKASTDENVEANPNFSFNDLEKRNREQAERMKKERERANKNVLRSYRIKN